MGDTWASEIRRRLGHIVLEISGEPGVKRGSTSSDDLNPDHLDFLAQVKGSLLSNDNRRVFLSNCCVAAEALPRTFH